MFGKKKKLPSQFSRYVDPTGELTNKELNAGLWYIRHKIIIARIATILLCIVSISLFGYGLIAWGNYLIFGYSQDQNMLAYQRASFTDVTALQQTYTPKKLEQGNADVFESGPGKYDFVARVSNPNQRYVAKISYQYIFDGGVTPVKEDTLLPGSDRPVGFFGYALEFVPSSAQLVIQKTSWQRLNPHVYPDPKEYIRPRVDFLVTNVLFIRGGEGAGDAHHVSFDVKNATAYSYWQPIFYVDFLQGDVVTGVSYLTLDEFRAGETRRVDLRSLAPGLYATDVRLWPVVNVFDRSVFMSPGQ